MNINPNSAIYRLSSMGQNPINLSNDMTYVQNSMEYKYAPDSTRINSTLDNTYQKIIQNDPKRYSTNDFNRLNTISMTNTSQQFRPISLNQFQTYNTNTYMPQNVQVRPTTYAPNNYNIKESNLVAANNPGFNRANVMSTPNVSTQNYYQVTNQIPFQRIVGENQFLEAQAQARVQSQPYAVQQSNKFENIPQNNVTRIDSGPQRRNTIGTGFQVADPSMVRNAGKKKKLGLYNLYSCLDEPYQRYKKFGCKNMKCSGNQCIASQEKASWLK